MEIKVETEFGAEIAAFLEEHLSEMRAVSPPESVHALDLESLQQPDITFWTLWREGELVGCGALKAFDHGQGEIKSMRTATHIRGEGLASTLLRHIMDEAENRGYSRLSLETGSMDYFIPAHHLYTSHGFIDCEPFGDYILDPNSIFMTKSLGKAASE